MEFELSKTKKGFVYLVGAGPGNPDYLTIKGLRAIESADVILYDALLEVTFLDLFPKKAKSIYVGKRCGKHSYSQADINQLILNSAKENNIVVRLKGGDPFIFGRGGEETNFLFENKIPFEIIPGVSSFLAASTLANIPITHRGISDQVLLLNGHSNIEECKWNLYANFTGTIIIFMGTKTIQQFANKLLQYGMDPNMPVGLIENASFQNQTVTTNTLKAVASSGMKKVTEGPGIIFIGRVVTYANCIQNE